MLFYSIADITNRDASESVSERVMSNPENSKGSYVSVSSVLEAGLGY